MNIQYSNRRNIVSVVKNDDRTRMPFSERRTIHVTHRSQKHLKQPYIFDLDLQITLTFR